METITGSVGDQHSILYKYVRQKKRAVAASGETASSQAIGDAVHAIQKAQTKTENIGQIGSPLSRRIGLVPHDV